LTPCIWFNKFQGPGVMYMQNWGQSIPDGPLGPTGMPAKIKANPLYYPIRP